MVGYSCPDQSPSAVNGPLLKMHSLSGGGHVEPSFSSLGLVVKLKLGIFFASMISVSCFLALGLLSSTATGSGLPPAGIPGSIQRNLVEPRRSEPLKRSTGVNEQTCTAPPGAESNLRSNTHSFTFTLGSVSPLWLSWVGEGSGVLLVLTTFQVPLFMMRFGQSNLYRSEDYGKTFKDVSHLINHTFVHSEFGIASSPDNSGKVILVGEVSEIGGARLFRSQDFGLTFVPTDLPFEPLFQIQYNPGDCNTLLSLSITSDLWLSEDFGATWRKIHDSACMVRWGPKNSIYITTNYNGSCNDKGMLALRKTTDYGQTFKTIATRVYSFILGGKFLIASIMTGKGTQRVIHVSVDGGEVWNMAQLPIIDPEQFYSVLEADQDLIFIHVDDPGDSGVGTIYVSDDRGIVFSKSLERNIYTTTGGDTDFTTVKSLRGVYMTTVLTEDGTMETMITFDQGGRWQTLHGPKNSHCDSGTSTNRPITCRLHIHASYSTTLKMNVPSLPYSQPNAVGLILAHGSVGDGESALSPNVYVSDDGGYSWFLALTGPHHYEILDSGALLLAVEHTNSPVNQIKFSTNEGQCWNIYNFTNDPLYFGAIVSEPGFRSMNVSLWGYRNRKKIVITIDFRMLLTRDCTEKDYVQWMAHSTDPNGLQDGCVLGYKETFLRLRKDSVCWNGRDYAVAKKLAPCTCTMDDYHCDFGYYRRENSSECVEQEEMIGRPLEFCLNGTAEQLQTSGYRKIPGDQCEGGFQPTRKEIELKRICTSNLLHQNSPSETSSPNAAIIVMIVIVILLMSGVAGVWLVKKYVCGGRFLVHRYSVMREHIEANKIEEVDDVDTQNVETGKAQYNEDSDQDLLE